LISDAFAELIEEPKKPEVPIKTIPIVNFGEDLLPP
jgi:hypothetical protein